jgi:hypothetical protein
VTRDQTIRAAERLGFHATHPNLRSPQGPQTVAIACPPERASEARALLEGPVTITSRKLRDAWQPHFSAPLNNLALIVGSPLKRKIK